MTKNKYNRRLPKYEGGSNLANSAADMVVPGLGQAMGEIQGATNSIGTAVQGDHLDPAKQFGGAFVKSIGQGGLSMITGGIQSIKEYNKAKQEKEAYDRNIQIQNNLQEAKNFQQTIKNNQANIPTFPNGGNTKPTYMSREQLLANNVNNDAAQFYKENPLNSPETYQKLIGNPSLRGQMYNLVKGYTGSPNDSTALFTAGVNEHTIPYEENNLPQYESMQGLRNSMTGAKPIPFNTMKQKLNVRADGGDLNQPQQQAPQPSNQPYIINYKGASHVNGGIAVNAESGNPTSITGEEAGAEVEGKHVSNTPMKGEIAVRFKNTESPYIFSDKLGYAKQAAKIQKKYSLRPNDKLSQDTMYQELEGLMGEQEEARQKLNPPVQYEDGGGLEQYTGDNPFGQFLNSSSKEITPEFRFNDPSNYAKTDFTDQIVDSPIQVNQGLANMDYSSNMISNGEGNSSAYTGHVSPIGAVVNMVSNAILMATNKKAPGMITPYIDPQKIDLSAARDAIRSNAVYSRANRLASLRGAGLSQAQYAGATSVGDTDINRNVGEGITQSYLTEQGTNAGYKQQANMANASNSMHTQQYNSAIQDRYNKEQQEYLASILNTPNEYLNAEQQSQKEALALSMRNPNVSFKQKNRGSKIGNLLLGPTDIYKSYK